MTQTSDDFKIIPLRPGLNGDAVEMLELALERAKSGELKSVAISWVTSENSIGGDISEGDHNLIMFAALSNTLEYFKNKTFNLEDG